LIAAMETYVLEQTRPDLTLIFDMPVEVGLERAHARAGSEMRFESKGLAFHERLREGFLAIARAEPDRCAIVDAKGTLDEVEAEVWAAVESRLAVHG
jgi:dTMP kinase